MWASLTFPPEADLISGDNPVYVGNIYIKESKNVNWTLNFRANGVFNLDVNASGYKQNTGEYIEKHGYATVTVHMIKILSPGNTTYTTDSVPLTFAVGNPNSWIGYSLDGQANVTITGNTTLVGLSDGPHSVEVYANHTSGNKGSDKVCFTVDSTRIPGDVNGDCVVDLADISMMIYAFVTKPGDPKWNPYCDANSDSIIDLADISIAIENFMKTCPDA